MTSTVQTSSANEIFKVGDKVTEYIGTDQYVGTIVKVTSRTVSYQFDDMKQVGDYYSNQKWICTPNPKNEIRVARRNRLEELKHRGNGVWIGAFPYQDPNF